MSVETLLERLRQLQALDLNAREIYLDLVGLVDNSQIKKQLQSVAKDEARHVDLEKRLLSLVSAL